MIPPHTITVSAYLARVAPAGERAYRVRWRAELVTAGDDRRHAVEGFYCPDEAIGALIRAVALAECPAADDVVDLVAGLFGSKRSADVTLGRAVRIASRHPRRKHPGATVVIAEPDTARVPAPTKAALAVKGGAA